MDPLYAQRNRRFALWVGSPDATYDHAQSALRGAFHAWHAGRVREWCNLMGERVFTTALRNNGGQEAFEQWLQANPGETLRQPPGTYTYKVRGLPCNIVDDDDLWCVSVAYTDGSGGGVLEWCYDQEDAEVLAMNIRRDSTYTNVSVSKWKDA